MYPTAHPASRPWATALSPTVLLDVFMKKASLLLTFAILASSACAAGAMAETLPSGVVVTQIKEGTGAQPTAADTVTVNYRGTLENGTEFDSSYKRGTPASFPLGRVIPCWTQGVQKIKVGGKAKLECPAATAYGDRGVGAIPPNSNLIFEVELLKIGN
jgi:FKBP-type peptidyl-prolyl cis-trans isomerase FkpA